MTMNPMLPRGCSISEEKRIKRMIAEGAEWQIYSTNLDSYALAVTPDQYSKWVENFSLPTGLFDVDSFAHCCVFSSSGNYLVSSLEQGPFPENNTQVEAFSVAFSTATKLFPQACFSNAIYLEEYSLLLPTESNQPEMDNAVIYGRWLSGGVSIPITTSFNRVSGIMSWLAREELYKSASLAGFTIEDEPKTAPLQTTVGKPAEQIQYADHLPEDRPDKFVLLGRSSLEQFFNDNIIDIVLHQEQYKRMGIAFPGATILYGPPGCGKTYAVERLAEYLEWPRFDIDSGTVASPYIHDTSKKISEIFQSAIQSAPSVLIIDEMEAFLSDRGNAAHSGTHKLEEMAEFLRRIPEAVSKGVLVFAMTNMIDSIDPAILRRGRFDHLVEVNMPGAEEIEALLLVRFKELPVDETVDAKAIASALSGRPMSDVTFVLREAGRLAVKQNLRFMDQNCFDAALQLFPKKEEKRKIGF